MLVDDTIVAFVDKDCVVMLVVLEEFCTYIDNIMTHSNIKLK